MFVADRCAAHCDLRQVGGEWHRRSFPIRSNGNVKDAPPPPSPSTRTFALHSRARPSEAPAVPSPESADTPQFGIFARATPQTIQARLAIGSILARAPRGRDVLKGVSRNLTHLHDFWPFKTSSARRARYDGSNTRAATQQSLASRRRYRRGRRPAGCRPAARRSPPAADRAHRARAHRRGRRFRSWPSGFDRAEDLAEQRPAFDNLPAKRLDRQVLYFVNRSINPPRAPCGVAPLGADRHRVARKPTRARPVSEKRLGQSVQACGVNVSERNRLAGKK